jgi:5-methylcytosine-specific restriction endonuclease McrA
MKICRKCKVEFDLMACPVCNRNRYIAWRKANGEKLALSRAKYYKENKDKIKAASSAWNALNKDKRRITVGKYTAANRDKLREKNVIYRKTHPEKDKASKVAWLLANPDFKRIDSQNRRALIKSSGSKLSTGLTEKLFKLQKGKCPCCEKPLGKDFHIDHIMPISKGGANEDWNIQLLRQQCNNQKCAKDPIDFMQSRGKLL